MVETGALPIGGLKTQKKNTHHRSIYQPSTAAKLPELSCPEEGTRTSSECVNDYSPGELAAVDGRWESTLLTNTPLHR